MSNQMIFGLCITVCAVLIFRLIKNIIKDIIQYKTRKQISDLAKIAVCSYYLLNSDDGRQLIYNVMKEAQGIINGKEEKRYESK